MAAIVSCWPATKHQHQSRHCQYINASNASVITTGFFYAISTEIQKYLNEREEIDL